VGPASLLLPRTKAAAVDGRRADNLVTRVYWRVQIPALLGFLSIISGFQKGAQVRWMLTSSHLWKHHVGLTLHIGDDLGPGRAARAAQFIVDLDRLVSVTISTSSIRPRSTTFIINSDP
jgi:hypothetical protein